MKVEELICELKAKSCYKEAESNFFGMFFCAAFLIFDLEQKTTKIQLDFLIPSENKIVSFEHPFDNFKKHEDKIENILEQTVALKIDLENLEKKVLEILEKNECQKNNSKIIGILKNNEWNVTVINKSFGIFRIKIDAISGEGKFFEKGSLFDFMGIRKK